MNQYSFFQVLKKNLNGIPSKEYQDILRDFEEHFHLALAEGKSEHQISEELGNPKMLAQSLKADFVIDEARKKPSWSNLQQAIITSLGIGLFNFMFILPVFIILIAVIGSIILTGLVTTGVSFVPFMRVEFLEALFNAFLCVGVGLLLFICGVYLAKQFYYWFLKYLNWNTKLFKGGKITQ